MEQNNIQDIVAVAETKNYEDNHSESVLVTTIGLVIHCLADGMALGTSVFCK